MIYIINNGDAYSSMYKLETTRNTINDSRIKMSFFGDTWSEHVRGTEVASLKDHGNGINIKLSGGTKIKLDYAEAEEVAAILKFYNEDSGCTQLISKTLKLKEI